MIDVILAATGGPPLPISLIVKVSLVLAVAAAATLLMSRASAATRHMVWGMAIVGVLALPLLAVGLPRWEVASKWAADRGQAPASTAEVTMVGTETAAEAVATADAIDRVGSSPLAGTEASSPSAPSAGGAGAGPPWLLIAWVVWGAGALLLLLRLVSGWLGTRRLSLSSERVTDEGWLQLLKDASWLLDVDREVVLLRSETASMPMTWGTRRPSILLPAEADHWPDERRRVVLLHEMAHVARRDCLTQTFAELATALYWFHPLAWVAARQLRRERERACDDCVLTAGEGATSYAGHLLEVARAFRGETMYRAAAIGMARPSQLEGRLLAVLDSARRRSGPARREILLASGVAAVVVVPLATLHAVQPEGTNPSSTLFEQVRSTVAESRDAAPASSAQPRISDSRTGGLIAADSVVDLRVAARPGGTVVLNIEGGNLTVVGWENDSVELHAELRGRSASEMVVELMSRNGQVTLLSENVGRGRDGGGNHSFELRVPIRSSLEIESGGGGVSLENLSGTYTGSTGGGDIILDRLAGRAELSTGGGNVRVNNSRLDGAVSTGGGNVTLVNNDGNLRGDTGGGNVRVENSSSRSRVTTTEPTRIQTGGGDIELFDLPAGADLATGGGNITVRSVGGPLIAKTGAGSIRVDEAAASVELDTGSGEIRLGAARESVTARTGNGDIRVNLLAGTRGRSVELMTGSGNVTLDLPAGFEGTFEVIITSRNPNSRQVRSDFPLASEFRNIDGRRALVATGVVGSGRDRVTIHTSSGNVTIRGAGNGQAAAGGSVPAPGANRNVGDNDFDSLDAAFSEAFGEDFESQIEELVSSSVGGFASGIARFTANITASALEVAVVALEQAEREGSLTAEDRRELAELRGKLAERTADRK